MSKISNGKLLDRILDPISSSLNEEAARKLIGLKADRKTEARVAKLAIKCNEGTLTPRERREYEMYVMMGHIDPSGPPQTIRLFQLKTHYFFASLQIGSMIRDGNFSEK
jgi:hypothetical protein